MEIPAYCSLVFSFYIFNLIFNSKYQVYKLAWKLMLNVPFLHICFFFPSTEKATGKYPKNTYVCMTPLMSSCGEKKIILPSLNECQFLHFRQNPETSFVQWKDVNSLSHVKKKVEVPGHLLSPHMTYAISNKLVHIFFFATVLLLCLFINLSN